MFKSLGGGNNGMPESCISWLCNTEGLSWYHDCREYPGESSRPILGTAHCPQQSQSLGLSALGKEGCGESSGVESAHFTCLCRYLGFSPKMVKFWVKSKSTHIFTRKKTPQREVRGRGCCQGWLKHQCLYEWLWALACCFVSSHLSCSALREVKAFSVSEHTHTWSTYLKEGYQEVVLRWWWCILPSFGTEPGNQTT